MLFDALIILAAGLAVFLIGNRNARHNPTRRLAEGDPRLERLARFGEGGMFHTDWSAK